jgi:hypothetical protein
MDSYPHSTKANHPPLDPPLYTVEQQIAKLKIYSANGLWYVIAVDRQYKKTKNSRLEAPINKKANTHI